MVQSNAEIAIEVRLEQIEPYLHQPRQPLYELSECESHLQEIRDIVREKPGAIVANPGLTAKIFRFCDDIMREVVEKSVYPPYPVRNRAYGLADQIQDILSESLIPPPEVRQKRNLFSGFLRRPAHT